METNISPAAFTVGLTIKQLAIKYKSPLIRGDFLLVAFGVRKNHSTL